MSSKPAEGAPDDGKVDGTFHSPEWHAARVKELMAPRMTWEEYKGKEKEKEREEERKRQEQEELEVEYLKQVAAAGVGAVPYLAGIRNGSLKEVSYVGFDLLPLELQHPQHALVGDGAPDLAQALGV